MIRKTLANTQAATFAVMLPTDSGMAPTGTGFFISPDGWFVTAAHVVTKDNSPHGERRSDIGDAWLKKERRSMQGAGAMCQWPQLHAIVPSLDFALLRVDFARNANKEFLSGKTAFSFLQVSTRVLEEGEPIYAFGYPLSGSTVLVHNEKIQAHTVELQPRTTSGIVSSTYNRSGLVMTNADPEVYIIDRALNFGNSGGPIIAEETGNVHAFCSTFQTMGMRQKQYTDAKGQPLSITVPSLYGTVISLHNPLILEELRKRGVPLTDT
jgi:serine protease Do